MLHNGEVRFNSLLLVLLHASHLPPHGLILLVAQCFGSIKLVSISSKGREDKSGKS